MFSVVKATTALLLLLSSTVSATDPAKVLIDPSTFPDFVKYATFVAASTNQPCNNPPFGAITYEDFSIASTDTQASIYRLDSNQEFILAFPGSASITDFLTDLDTIPLPYPTAQDCDYCLVHAGFANAFVSIAPSLNQSLQQAIAQFPTYTITVTGGSLGGALGKLAFDYFKDSTIFGSKVTAGWSFGEPRVGNDYFANYTDTLTGASNDNIGLWHRVTHANDPIPLLPPTSLDFQHSRTELWESNNLLTGAPDAGDTFRCFGQEPVDCVNGQVGVNPLAHVTYAGYTLNACS